MAVIDAVEGIVGQSISFHYDLEADVLYLRRLDELDTPRSGRKTTRASSSSTPTTTSA